MKLWTLLSALILDLLFGDPPNRLHPVVLIGNYFTAGRKRAPRENRFQFGALWTLSGVALFALPMHAIRRWIRHPMANAFLLKPIFAYRNLRRAVQSVGDALRNDDLPAARRLLAWHLVSRNTDTLSAEEVAAATIESLAENLTDSVAAPLMAFSLGGLPAAWAYRVINTADAMWGYRTAEFEQLGKFPARLDDALNYFPARLTGWLIAISAGRHFNRAKNTMLSQHARTDSPNAGWTMAAMAGTLGVTLGKRGVYSLEGGNADTNWRTIRRAMRVADTAVGLLVALLVIRHPKPEIQNPKLETRDPKP